MHRCLPFGLLLALLLSACAAPSPAPSASPAQRGGSNAAFRVRPEVRIYPAGVITSVTGRMRLDERNSWFAQVGYNTTRRRDWGEHDDERGGGPGLGLGWRRDLSADPRQLGGPFVGARADLWQLDVDWRDGVGAGATFGETRVVVLQPTVEGGWVWNLGGGWRLASTLGFGYEVNIDTDGEDVGEGPIGLLGFGLHHRGR